MASHLAQRRVSECLKNGVFYSIFRPSRGVHGLIPHKRQLSLVSTFSAPDSVSGRMRGTEVRVHHARWPYHEHHAKDTHPPRHRAYTPGHPSTEPPPIHGTGTHPRHRAPIHGTRPSNGPETLKWARNPSNGPETLKWARNPQKPLRNPLKWARNPSETPQNGQKTSKMARKPLKMARKPLKMAKKHLLGGPVHHPRRASTPP